MRFWNFINKADAPRELVIGGEIADEDWFEDDVTPKNFESELKSGTGPLTLWINSPGGSCFAAAQIYNMLQEYDGEITVKIDSLCASAATVIAMAGDKVMMSPVGVFMVHNPITVAMGNKKDMEQTISILDTIKDTIINAYEKKTGMSRNKIAKLMDDETWMDARKAKELGFVDEIIEKNTAEGEKVDDMFEPFIFSKKQCDLKVANSIAKAVKVPEAIREEETDTFLADARSRLLEYL